MEALEEWESGWREAMDLVETLRQMAILDGTSPAHKGYEVALQTAYKAMKREQEARLKREKESADEARHSG